MYLTKRQIEVLLDKELIIRPLLNPAKQINEISVDFRLGYDFLVSIQGREPFIDASLNNQNKKPISSFFQETRRRLGETFMLHPNQTILATSLEYIQLPCDVFAELNMRSTYSRLGMAISTVIQPGYKGCVSLELTNNSKNSINLTVGALIFQARFCKITEGLNYFSSTRKYICQVRPEVSAINLETDLQTLNDIWKSMNNIPVQNESTS